MKSLILACTIGIILLSAGGFYCLVMLGNSFSNPKVITVHLPGIMKEKK